MSTNIYPAVADTAEAAPLLGDDASASEILSINVSGRRFQTRAATLRRLPLSLLGDEQRRAAYRDPQSGELFFDRSSDRFAAVLHVFQSGGHVRRPPHVSPHVFLDDVRFYQLGAAVERVAQVEVAGGGQPSIQRLAKSLLLPIGAIGLIWFIALLVFAALMYWAEHEVNGYGFTYPQWMWFALATLTTVGYGDITPLTTGGKVVGSLCACFGYLTTTMLVAVVVRKLLSCGSGAAGGGGDATVPVALEEGGKGGSGDAKSAA